MDKLRGLPIWKLILIAFLTQQVLGLIFPLLLSLVGIDLPEVDYDFESLEEEFLGVLILNPIIETLICQELIMNLTNWVNKWLFKRKLIAVSIVISATVFALSHDYPWGYILIIFTSGLIYSTFHTLVKSKTNDYAWFFTALVHSLYNLKIFIERNVLTDYF